MNDFRETEAELKKLRPAPVSDRLAAQIERALLAPATPTAAILPRAKGRQTIMWSLGVSLAGGCALVLLGLGFFEPTPHTPPRVAQQTATPPPAQPNDNGYRPAALTRTVYQRRDEGLVFSPNQSEQLLRRVRYNTRETMQWRNPRTGASLRVSYPSEQVVLTPVAFQ